MLGSKKRVMDNFEIQIKDEYILCAIEAVRKVTDLFLEGYGSASSNLKGDGSPVTMYDTKIEEKIVAHLLREYPNSGIIGEENAATESNVTSEIRWIIDPIDGTVNYELGALPSAISIGIEIGGQLHGGVVSLPLKDKIYYARSGEGAYSNEKEISVLDTEDKKRFIVGAEFRPVNIELEGYMDMVKTVSNETQRIRTINSGISDGVHVASGRLHASYVLDTNIWDVVSPTILVREAGGSVTTTKGSKEWSDIRKGNAVYSNGTNHEYLISFF